MALDMQEVHWERAREGEEREQVRGGGQAGRGPGRA